METNGMEYSKIPVSILMKPQTRELLSNLYNEKYKFRFHSFSIFLEEMLLIALREVEAIE